MEQAELDALRAKWTVDMGDDEDPDIRLKACSMKLEHAGRWTLEFGNQGFDAGQFGEYVPVPEDDGRRRCRFQLYVTEPDVAYYDASLELKSRHAYDVMLMARDLHDDSAMRKLDKFIGMFFEALLKGDAAAAGKYLSGFDIGTGAVSFNANDLADGLVFELELRPIG